MNRAGAIELLDAGGAAGGAVAGDPAAGSSTGPSCCASRTGTSATSCIQPTSEEVITDIARNELRSYRQLPVNFYQIQTKFRDELRPRFGVMRGREFIMKDAYSFHADYADLEREYRSMYDTYTRIFTRLGLKFRAVAADTGAIGGTGSHEFQVLADSGEDAIAYCAGLGLRRQRRAGRGAGARRAARRARGSRCRRSPRRARPPARMSRSCSELPLAHDGQGDRA